MARYLIFKGPDGDRRYRLTQPIVTIGRGQDCEIRLADTSVSRRHARLLVRESFCGIEDLGSSNGSQVNGQPLDGERQLASGDVVHIGNVEAVYLDEADAMIASGVADVEEGAAGGNLSLQGFLEGDATVDETIKGMSTGWSGGRRRIFDWRFKLVALVAGTISLGLMAIGAVLVFQQRDAWLGRAVLELRQLAAENLAALSAGDARLLSGDSVAGDRRVGDPVVLGVDGTVVWTSSRSGELVGEPWSGWPERRPSTREPTVLDPRSGASSQRPRILVPIERGGQLIGWVGAEWDRREAGSSGGLLGIVLAIGAFLVLLSYLVLEGSAAWVSRPVRSLAAEVRGLRRDEALAFEAPGGVPELQELVEAVRVALTASTAGQHPVAASQAHAGNDWAIGIPVPLVLLDDSYRVLDINPEAQRLLAIGDGLERGSHFGRALQGSYFGSSVLQLLKRCRPGEIDATDLELQRGAETVPMRVMVRRPARPAGYALALVVIPAGRTTL